MTPLQFYQMTFNAEATVVRVNTLEVVERASKIAILDTSISEFRQKSTFFDFLAENNYLTILVHFWYFSGF